MNLELSCDVSVSGGLEDSSNPCDSAGGLGFDTRGTDVGLLFGGGLGIAAGPGEVTLDARYDLGLTDVADDTEDALEIRNRSFLATAGYLVRVP